MEQVKINIYKGKFYSTSTWFSEEYYTTKEDDCCLTISKCYLEIPKSARKINSSKGVRITSNIPLGEYFSDEEESNEDKLVIYYSEQLN